ncbi:hypothetical protein [Bacillus thuringiensis]|nr:hypothetical protein [Bacillus thuringiensis]
MKQRRLNGITLAKKQGNHLGRPFVQITDEFVKAYNGNNGSDEEI